MVVNPFALHPKGGDHASELARELLGRGHAVRGFGARPGWIPRSGAPEGPGTLGLSDGEGLLGFRPHVIVAYDALSPAAWFGARRARTLRVPLILVEEGIPQAGRKLGRGLRRVGETLWGPFVRRTTMRLVALDGVAHDQALREGFPPAIVVDLDPGLSLTTFRPALASHLLALHDIRGRILLYVGPIDDSRSLDILVQAFATTVGQRSDWSLVMAGEGAARSQLRALADRYGVGSRVHWIAHLREEEIPGLMGASTLFAAPALDAGQAGRVVRWALACGLPVLAARSRRYEHLLEDDVTGLLAPAGDLEAWTAMLRRAASSPEGRQRWGKRARAVAEERFAWPRVAETFEQVVHDARADLVERLAAKGIALPPDLGDVSLEER